MTWRDLGPANTETNRVKGFVARDLADIAEGSLYLDVSFQLNHVYYLNILYKIYVQIQSMYSYLYIILTKSNTEIYNFT